MRIVIAANPFPDLVRPLMGSIQLVLPNHPNIMYRYGTYPQAIFVAEGQLWYGDAVFKNDQSPVKKTKDTINRLL